MEKLKKIGKYLINHPFFFIAIVLTIVILFMRECNPEPKTKTKVETHIVKIPVTNWKYDTIIRPEYYPSKIDTQAIISDYFSQIRYDTMIYIVDTAKVGIQAYISQNRLDSLGVNVNYYCPQAKKRMKLYAGLSGSNGIIGFSPGLSGNLMLQTKKNHIYHVGYDVINQRLEAGLMWNLKLKK